MLSENQTVLTSTKIVRVHNYFFCLFFFFDFVTTVFFNQVGADTRLNGTNSDKIRLTIAKKIKCTFLITIQHAKNFILS